jgi:hypothetical protein
MNWKVFSCEPGVCKTNNALESFNAMFKCSYTNHSCHTLPALLDIIMEALIVDLSREVMHGHKVFHTKHTPDWLSFANANSITADNYVILVQCLMVKLTRRSPTVHIMWMLTVGLAPVNTFITKGTASIWYFIIQRLNQDSNTETI